MNEKSHGGNENLAPINKDVMNSYYKIVQNSESITGIINKQGQYIFDPSKYRIKDIEYIDSAGYMIVNLKREPSEENWLAHFDGAYGIMNFSGDFLVQPVFEHIKHIGFDTIWAAKMKDEKYGTINIKGEWIIPPSFDDFNFGRYLWNVNGILVTTILKEGEERYGIMTEEGKTIFDPIFEEMNGVKNNDNTFIVRMNQKFGLINKYGEWLIEPQFDSFYEFVKEGIFQVGFNDKFGLIDIKGNWIIEPLFKSISTFNTESVFAQSFDNDKWGVIDMNGKWIIEPTFDEMNSLSLSSWGNNERDLYVKASVKEKWGLIDTSGNWIIQPQFESINSSPNTTVFKVRINEKEGLIDLDGKWVSEPVLDQFGYNYGEYIVASLKRKWGLINTKGEWVVEPVFDELGSSYGEYIVASLKRKWGLINTKGEWVVEPICVEMVPKRHETKDGTKYQLQLFDEQGYIRVKKSARENSWGFINLKGEWVVKPNFWMLGFFDEEGLAIAYIDKKEERVQRAGLLNRKGEWVIEPNNRTIKELKIDTYMNPMDWM